MQTTKLATLGVAQFVTWPVFINGLVLVPFMILGTLLGKRMLDRVSERAFGRVIDVVLVLAGLRFLIKG